MANAALVLLIAGSLPMLGAAQGSPGFGGVPAILAAALFLLHPLGTQAVSYAAQRSESLAAFFVLSALLLHLRSLPLRSDPIEAESHSEAQSLLGRPWLGLLALLMVLPGFLVKESALASPLIIAALDFGLGPREGRGRRLAPWLALLILVPSLGFAMGLGAPLLEPRELGGGDPRLISSLSYLATQPIALCRYLLLFLLPIGQSIDHGLNPVAGPLEARFLGACLFLGGAALFLVRSRKPVPQCCAAAALASLIPSSSLLVLADPMAEQRCYLPLAFAALALGHSARGLAQTRPGSRRPLLALAIFILVALAGLCRQRNELWKSPMRLWQDAALKAPEKARPLASLGVIVLLDAITELPRLGLSAPTPTALAELLDRRAIALAPRYAPARLNLAHVLIAQARTRLSAGRDPATLRAAAAGFIAAEEELEKLLESRPSHAIAWLDIGQLRQRYLQDDEGAEEAFRRAIDAGLQDPRVWLSRGDLLLLRLGRPQEAIRCYQAFLRTKPDGRMRDYASQRLAEAKRREALRSPAQGILPDKRRSP